MTLRDLWWVLQRDTRRRPWQNRLVIAILAFSAIGLIVATSTSRMVQASAAQDLERLGSGLIRVESGEPLSPIRYQDVSRLDGFNEPLPHAAMARLPNLRVETICGDSETLVPGLTVVSAEESLADVTEIQMASGRWIGTEDQREIVVGARSPLTNRLVAGRSTLCLNGRPYPVVGQILNPTGLGDIDEGVVISRAWEAEDGVDVVFMDASRHSSMDDTAAIVKAMFAHRRASTSLSRDLIAARVIIDDRLDLMSYGLAALIFALTTIVSTSSSILDIRQQRGELGLIMAFGRSRRSIAAQFMAAGAVRGLQAAVIATVVSVTAVASLSIVTGWPLVVQSSAVLIAIVAVLSSAVLSALGSTLAASRLDPKEVLRGR